MKTNTLFRGFYHSEDGIITKIIESDFHSITFTAEFPISKHHVKQFQAHPEYLFFSERSRIARLGIMITSEPPDKNNFKNNRIILTMNAFSAIYPISYLPITRC